MFVTFGGDVGKNWGIGLGHSWKVLGTCLDLGRFWARQLGHFCDMIDICLGLCWKAVRHISKQFLVSNKIEEL